jgi:hypothetical protein
MAEESLVIVIYILDAFHLINFSMKIKKRDREEQKMIQKHITTTDNPTVDDGKIKFREAADVNRENYKIFSAFRLLYSLVLVFFGEKRRRQRLNYRLFT